MKKSGYRTFRQLTPTRLSNLDVFTRALSAGKIDVNNLIFLRTLGTTAKDRKTYDLITFTYNRKTYTFSRWDLGLTNEGADRLINIADGTMTTRFSDSKNPIARAMAWLNASRDTALNEQARKTAGTTTVGSTVAWH